MKRFFALLLILALLLAHTASFAVMTPPYPLEPTAAVWRTYDPALRYYYQQLTEPEKRRFSARYDSIALGQAELWDYPGARLTRAGIARINYVMAYDCPELQYHLLDDLVEEVDRVQPPDAEACARHSARMAEMLSACMDALDAIRLEPEWGESDFEKEVAVDRYLARNCRYEREAEGAKMDVRLRTAYSALANGSAVCAGYAEAVTLALRCLGIPCVRVNGEYYPGDGSVSGHAWNLVRIGGEWYHEDATWNDADSDELLEDFCPCMNRTSTEVAYVLRAEQLRVQLGFTIPFCGAVRDNYYVRKGQMLDGDWQETAAALLEEAYAQGKHAIGFRFSDLEAFLSAVDLLESGEPTALDAISFPFTYCWIESVNFLHFSW